MNCQAWPSSIDDIHGPKQARFLEHLRTCEVCRARAASHDATLLFSALPPASVDSDEIDSMRAAVHQLRRVHHLHSVTPRRSWRRAVALAAVVMVALILAPERPVAVPPGSVPFSGALGVGPGSLELDAKGKSTGDSQSPVQHRTQIDYRLLRADWRIQEIPAQGHDAGERGRVAGRKSELLAMGILEVPPTGVVEQQIDDDYGIRFEMVPLGAGDRLALRGFELSQRVDSREKVLVAADLLLTVDEPLLLKVQGPGPGGRSLVVMLQTATGSPDDV